MKKVSIISLMILLILPALAFANETNYTGCLNSNSGVLKDVAIGHEPFRPCAPPYVEIHWNQEGPQGASGVGNLGVYDGTGLFLGYYVSGEGEYRVFNTDIPAFLRISSDAPSPSLIPVLFANNVSRTSYFTSSDCSSQPYLIGPYASFNELYLDSNTNKFYIYDPQIPIARESDMISCTLPPGWFCNNQQGCVAANCCCNSTIYCGPDSIAVPVKEITIPSILTMTLQYPIIVKPVE